MAMTFEELKEKLKREPEITLLEVLEIDSEELVERFEDIIEVKFDSLSEEYNEEINEFSSPEGD